MNHTLRGLVAALGLTAGLVPPAHADSDGFYCIGHGYVAYEGRGLSIPAETHTVFIVKVGGQEGISDPITVTIEEFHVNGMYCGGELIVFRNGHAIDISDIDRPRYLGLRPELAIPQDSQSGNLAFHYDTGAYTIPSDDDRHYYSLVMFYVEESLVREGGGIIMHHMIARVTQATAWGDFIRSRIIHDGITIETID
jgi:hypothetical protein